jgi:hypothetical protein
MRRFCFSEIVHDVPENEGRKWFMALMRKVRGHSLGSVVSIMRCRAPGEAVAESVAFQAFFQLVRLMMLQCARTEEYCLTRMK